MGNEDFAQAEEMIGLTVYGTRSGSVLMKTQSHSAGRSVLEGPAVLTASLPLLNSRAVRQVASQS